ncbi:MAG: 6-pyruvoyl-tetrahydropterin synthase-related protein [Terracidiphilus sp.]
MRPGNGIGPALILLAAAVAALPQLIRGSSCGHDFNVHLVSWLDCLNAWRHGILYPQWASSPNYGAGEPRFVFYPPLTWMLGAALGAVLPWSLAPIALTFLMLAAAGLATRALALEALDDLPAALAGCVAIFSGFALFTAYERGAFPEFAGGALLPLIVLFTLRDRRPSAGPPIWAPFGQRVLRRGGSPIGSPAKADIGVFRRAFDGSTVPLALALAGAWLSDLPLGVMAGYLLVGLALLWAVVNKTWAPLLRAALATILGLSLAAFYWLPAALERHWVDIRQSTDDPNSNFENSWAFARHADPLLAPHDEILHRASWIAVSMIAVALAALLVAWRRGAVPFSKSPASRRLGIPLAAIPAVVLFLLFPISRPLWHLLPEMSFLQYPWRLLEAVEAPMAILFVAAVWPRGRRARIAVLAACAALFLAATVYAGAVFFQVCLPEDTVASVVAAHCAGAGFEGMFEYEPPHGDITEIATGLPDVCLVADPSIALGVHDPQDPEANPAWAPDEGSCLAMFSAIGGDRANPEHRKIVGATAQTGYLVLRLLSFPAWTVRVNGVSPASLPQRDDGLIVAPVPQGPFELTVDWTTTPGVILGRWVSSLSILLLLALFLLERRNRRSRQT